MRRAYERIIKAYKFFCDAEKAKLRFTLEEITAVTGWTLQTVCAYRSKKWYWFLQEEHDKFFCEGICEYTAFRTPAYLVLMNIAFTALFHAIFERDQVEYYYKKPDGTPSRIIDGEPTSWELTTCADYYCKGVNTPFKSWNYLLPPSTQGDA